MSLISSLKAKSSLIFCLFLANFSSLRFSFLANFSSLRFSFLANFSSLRFSRSSGVPSGNNIEPTTGNLPNTSFIPA